MRIVTLTLWTLLLVTPTLAQSYVHAYGGTTVIPKDNFKANFIGAGGVEAGPAYIGLEAYGIRPVGEERQLLQDLANLTGTDIVIKGGGYDFVGGGAIAKTSRYSVIPVGIVGYSGFEACLESDCSGDSKQANFGGGVMFRIMANDGVGLHTGFRYTRNYGAALTVGIVFGGN